MRPKPADLAQALRRPAGHIDAGSLSVSVLPDERLPQAAAAPGTRRPSRIGMRNVTGYFPPEVARQLRLLAAEQDRTIQSLVGEALNDLFAKYHKPELVAGE